MDHAATHSVVDWEGNHQLFSVGLAHLLHGDLGSTVKEVNKLEEHFFEECLGKCNKDFCTGLMLDLEPGSIKVPNFLTFKKVHKKQKRSAPKIATVEHDKKRKTTSSGA